MGALRHAASGLGWFGIFALLVLSPAIGSIASVAAVLTAVLLTPVAFTGDGWDELRRQPALLAMPAAFGVLVLLFAVTARHSGDVLFAANFFALLLAPTVYLLARHRAGARTVLVLSTLCALGTLVGALTASYDVFLQHKDRAVGWASGGNLMARTVIPLGFLALAGMLVSSSRWRWLYLMAPVLALYTLYLTGTRGVFVAVPVLAVLIVLTVLDQRRSPWMAYVVGIGLAAAIVVLVAMLSQRFLGVGDILREIATRATVTDGATTERLYKYIAGYHTFFKSPWIGVGWANITEASKPFVVDKSYHNDALNIGVAAGIPGIVCWIVVLLAPLAGLRFVPPDRFGVLRRYGASLLFITMFIFGLTDMTFGYDLPTTLHAFLTAVVLGAYREPTVTPAGSSVAARPASRP